MLLNNNGRQESVDRSESKRSICEMVAKLLMSIKTALNW